MRAAFDDLPRYADHVLVDGSFDPLHAGHLAYLNAARQLSKGPLLCAVASDQQIREKGREPLLPQESRVAVLEALCDVVYAKDRPTEQVIEKLAPPMYVKGADWEDRLPPGQISACGRMGTRVRFVATPKESSTAYLRAWARADEARHLEQFERLVQAQKPATVPWQPVTDYSFEARRAIEGRHPELIEAVFLPCEILDVGCGPGHLVRLMKGVRGGYHACGMDLAETTEANESWYTQGDISDPCLSVFRRSDGSIDGHELVICREVLEHLTIRQLRVAVSNLCRLSSKFVYVTTRFAKDPAHLLSVDTSDDLDPTHCTMLNQNFLRTLFVLEGAKRRADLEERMDWQKKGRVLCYEIAN